MPPPNPRCGFGSRVMSSVSGSANTSGSRAAAPSRAATFPPSATRCPAISMSAVAVRSNSCSGESYRISSSAAEATSAGSPTPATSRSHCPRWVSRACTPLPSTLTVASCPAMSSSTAVATTSSPVRSLATRWLSRSSPGCVARSRASARRWSANSVAARSAASRRSSSRPYSYIFTMALLHRTIAGPSSVGTPSSSAITATGSGWARCSSRSASPSRAMPSARVPTIRSASASTVGRSRST